MPGPVWLPPVIGDPAGMRALAGRLRDTGAQIAAVQDGCRSAVGAMTFEGPAGEAFRSRVSSTESGLRGAADELESLAGSLERAAADVEAQQAEREAKLRQMIEEARAARAQHAS
jgi:uncharacterized protein YukE